ncbi:MAG TPA: HNH endonuclease, partial [Actinomycetes bacterium]|nr:HNH endonuclease [Actinomycetes bacterium]
GQRLARAQGRRVEIGVLVPYPTLIGLSELPGELDGFGPIPASVARRLAAGGTWRRILTDPATGRVLDYGSTRYRPPQDLIDQVIARDRTCRGIGCDRPARSCQIDHTIPYPDGPTAQGNTGPFCDRQHLFKTHGGWQVSQPTPGQFVWRTLTGHTYTKHPDPIGPIIDDDREHNGVRTDETTHPEEADPPPF